MEPARSVRPPRTVLVVEDHPDTLEMTAEVLRQHGFGVLTASTGGEALRVAAVHELDAIIADMGLPDMDGAELVRRLRRAASTATLPVVAVTGWASQADQDRARAAGCDRVLAKPCPPDTLLAVLHRLLAKRDPSA